MKYIFCFVRPRKRHKATPIGFQRGGRRNRGGKTVTKFPDRPPDSDTSYWRIRVWVKFFCLCFCVYFLHFTFCVFFSEFLFF